MESPGIFIAEQVGELFLLAFHTGAAFTTVTGNKTAAIGKFRYRQLTTVATFLTARKRGLECKLIYFLRCEDITHIAAVPAVFCYQRRAEGSHYPSYIRTDNILAGDYLKAAQYGIVVKGSALNDYFFSHQIRITELYDLIKGISHNRI